jgi:hypothetical protein
MNIVIDYPWWFLIFCVAAGGALSWLLYKTPFLISGVSENTRRFMLLLRFVGISIICFLLLSPLVKTLLRRVEKPVVAFVTDNSASMLVNTDKEKSQKQIDKIHSDFQRELEDKFDVRFYTLGSTFSDNKSIDFSDKESDISEAFLELKNRYYNRNLGAAILLSDGIYNRGLEPGSIASDLFVPVYCLAWGDTSFQKDAIIKKVQSNKATYLGNTFPVEILANINGFQGQTATLQLLRNNETVQELNFPVSSRTFNKNFSFQLKADNKGMQHYTIRLLPMQGELTEDNNIAHLYIEVLDARQKVLLLAAAPHPDVAAIRYALESSDSYETEFYLLNDFTKSTQAYNVVILHHIPSLAQPNNRVIKELMQNDVSRMVILGAETSPVELAQLQDVLIMGGIRSKNNDVQPRFVPAFAFFNLLEPTRQIINNLPPLQVPFANYKLNPGASVLMTQKIGMVETNDPLWAFNELNGKRSAVISGEGLWRWRMANFSRARNHDAFNDLFLKSVQYLSVKSSKTNLRINASSVYKESEIIYFGAQLYNESFEQITGPEIKMLITDKDNRNFEYQFSANENAYTLNAGNLPKGDYAYKASVKIGEKVYQQAGQFSVQEVNLESINTTANHNLLKNIAAKTGAMALDAKDYQQLIDALKNRDDIVAVSYSEKKLMDLINLWYVLAIILLLFTVEWFIRKRSGGY